jgi:maleamate amidohydrolase
MTTGAGVDRDATRDAYRSAGIGERVGWGERPALLVVDFQVGFTSPASAVGGALDPEVEATARLVRAFRERGAPIAFTAVGFQAGERVGSAWLRKMPGLAILEAGGPLCEIDPRVAPAADEPVWIKPAPSALHGTPALTFLRARDVDTVVVAGCVTSGCIRATTIDLASWGYRVIVPAECVGDRTREVHLSNLFDIDAKYGDVEPLEATQAAFASLDLDAGEVTRGV